MKRPIIFLSGPTASGKTRLAMRLCDHFPLDIVNVDAAQVYRGMDIGTAKPSLEELKHYPHRLIDICDPIERYNVADFCRDAQQEIDDIYAAQRIPILVGGTLFYFHALQFGLSDLPAADMTVRQQIADQAAELGWPALHQQLADIDPAVAMRIKPGDQQRIQRALEIHKLTGQMPSVLYQQQGDGLGHDVVHMGLQPSSREALYDTINRRFVDMIKAGLIDELQQLLQQWELTLDLPAMRMVGYRQVWQYLNGELNYDEMINKAMTASRHLAKRQLTWMRRYSGVKSFDAQDSKVFMSCQQYLAGKLAEFGI